ncbi:MAG: hypothetical protein K2O89_02805 [Clostridia bacterium]|nr:hypothetical protein [Clostridia bacterium]
MEQIEFTIKNKPITFKIAIAFTVTSIALALMMILVIIAFGIHLKVKFIWFIEVIPAVSMVFSVFGLYTFYKEEFSLKDGVFKYVKVFKKDIIFKAITISCVYMHPIGYKTKIEFVNKKGENAATVFDDGTILQDGILLDALEKLGIEVKRSGYGNE